WGEIAEAEEPVVEPSLERPELAGRNDKTKVRQGLTKRSRKLLATRPPIRTFAEPSDQTALDLRARWLAHDASMAMSPGRSAAAAAQHGGTQRPARSGRRSTRETQSGRGLDRQQPEVVDVELLAHAFELAPARGMRAEPPREIARTGQVDGERAPLSREPTRQV